MMNIYLCGPLGWKRAEYLYRKNEDAIKARFAGFFLRRFENIGSEMIQADRAVSCSMTKPFAGKVFIKETAEGGLAGALWDLAEEAGCGLEVKAELIPVHQEIIEIMELFAEEPYECPSAGCIVIFAKCREDADDICIRAGSHAGPVYIGRCTDTGARKIILKGGERYLTPKKRRMKDISDRRLHTQKTTVQK